MLEELIYENAEKFKDILQEGSTHEEFRNRLLGEFANFNTLKLFEKTAETYDDISLQGERLVYKSKYFDRVDNFPYKSRRMSGGQKWGDKVELWIEDEGVVKGEATSIGIVHSDPTFMNPPDACGFVQLPIGKEHFEEVFTSDHTPEDVRSVIKEHEEPYVELGKRWKLVDYDAEEIVETVHERDWS